MGGKTRFDEISAGGIIFFREKNSLRLLLVKDRFDKWTWPKGKLEKGETPPQAALREIREEVGLTEVRIIGVAGDSLYRYFRDGRPLQKKVTFYCMVAVRAELHIHPEEIRKAKWVEIPAAFGMARYRGARSLLRRAVRLYRAWERHAASSD